MHAITASYDIDNDLMARSTSRAPDIHVTLQLVDVDWIARRPQ